VADVAIYPMFSAIGGPDSPQAQMRQTMQQHINDPDVKKLAGNTAKHPF
jgi:hypothetical protein